MTGDIFVALPHAKCREEGKSHRCNAAIAEDGTTGSVLTCWHLYQHAKNSTVVYAQTEEC